VHCTKAIFHPYLPLIAVSHNAGDLLGRYRGRRRNERPMRDLFAAAKLLLLDMASTVFFLVVFLLSKNIPLSVALGVALGVA